MGFQFVVMFIDCFMDDVTYVRDVEVCMYSMILKLLCCCEIWGPTMTEFIFIQLNEKDAKF